MLIFTAITDLHTGGAVGQSQIKQYFLRGLKKIDNCIILIKNNTTKQKENSKIITFLLRKRVLCLFTPEQMKFRKNNYNLKVISVSVDIFINIFVDNPRGREHKLTTL